MTVRRIKMEDHDFDRLSEGFEDNVRRTMKVGIAIWVASAIVGILLVLSVIALIIAGIVALVS